jgi:hypothetical protein
MSIDVALENTAAHAAPRNVLFTDVSNNSLLVILTHTGPQLRLTAGPVVAESEASGAKATLVFIKIDLGDQLTDEQAAGLDVSCADWATAQYLEGWWSLAPASNSSLAKSSPVQVRIDGWPDFTTAMSGQIHIEYYRFGKIDDFTQEALFVHRAPGATPRPLDIDFGFGIGGAEESVTDTVYLSEPAGAEIENTLVLRITNPQQEDPIAGAAAGASQPKFTLCFPAGEKPRADALTTLDHAQAMPPPRPAEVDATLWDVQFDDQAGLPSWSLTPKGDPILGPHATVEFILTGLVVPPPEGVALVYLQHVNVPGYDDGVDHVDVPKLAPVEGILHFDCLSPTDPPAGTPVHLTWTTFAVLDEHIGLAYEYNQQPKSLSSRSSPPISANEADFTVPESIEDPTLFTLNVDDSNATGNRQAQVWITPYSTEVDVFGIGISPGRIGANDSATLSFRTANATSACIGIDGATVQLDIAVDGWVRCQLTTNDGTSIVVSQENVTKGELPLPAAFATAPQGQDLSVNLRAEAQDKDKNDHQETIRLDLRPASITSFNVVKRLDPRQRGSLCAFALWTTSDAVASKVTLDGIPLNKESGFFVADSDSDPSPGPYTLTAQGFGPPVSLPAKGKWS